MGEKSGGRDWGLITLNPIVVRDMLDNENGIDVVDDSEPPALASTQSDREEEAALESGIRLNDGCSLNRYRRLQTDVGCLKTKRQPLRI